MFRRMYSVPHFLEDIPGVWKNKRSHGFRVPINCLPLIDKPLPEGTEKLSLALSSKYLHDWVGDFLMEHQKAIINKGLNREGFHAWSPPGSGKTLCGIVWLAAHAGPKVVITKAAARGTWREEIRKYSSFEPLMLTGHKPFRLSNQKNVIYITAWETLMHWQKELKSLRIDALVMDEIHWAKNPKRVKAVVGKDGRSKWEPLSNTAAASMAVAHSAQRRLGLTATPIPNRPKDLWAQLDLVEPWQWGTFHTFGVRYCGGYQDTYGWKYDELSNGEELQERLRWSKHNTSQKAINARLPNKRRQVVYLEQSEQNRPSAFRQDIKRVAKTGDRESMFEVMLHEAASRKRKYIIDRVCDAVKSGQKVVVFTGRRKDCDKLGQELSGKIGDSPIWCAHGGTTSEGRDQIRKEYMEESRGCVLVGTGDAWGESVNLQDTDLALFVMLPWTPRSIGQWEGRFARLGQKRPVLITYVIASGTVDEHVAELLVDKLPAVGQVADDEVIQEVEAAFSGTQEDLLGRISSLFST
ncbi:MAG: hypothetical protein Unbinned80contig1000_41 [Prokaryotic dsDNA virus sp.]|nr:MAG: hypothetical protein Unbinned80contig1000_41 [Prokaryotic dsDNA virus sp.]|tara:strand:+ start:4778 stop:6349 length:1572 start_codon:yes stop_codon:yes gene_type:complete